MGRGGWLRRFAFAVASATIERRVEEAEARSVLGVGPRANVEELRTAFRRKLRQAHPDLVPDDPGATLATARLVSAYAVLRRAGPALAWTPATDPGVVASSHVTAVTLDGDSLTYPAPPDEVYRRLVAATDQLGELTYVDPDARLLDTVVTTADGTACSLLASLQGRAHGTEVFFTLEPLGQGRCLPVEPLVAELAALLAAGPSAS
ncbi:hypothetical protein BH20ACT1_BH20ACT1_00150 [soil metagenome]